MPLCLVPVRRLSDGVLFWRKCHRRWMSTTHREPNQLERGPTKFFISIQTRTGSSWSAGLIRLQFALGFRVREARQLEPSLRADLYLIPATIDSTPVSCSTRRTLNPASLFPSLTSAPC